MSEGGTARAQRQLLGTGRDGQAAGMAGEGVLSVCPGLNYYFVIVSATC